MNTKRLFSNLMRSGTRLALLTSLIMAALVGTVLPAAAAPSPSPQAAAISIDLHAVAGTTSLPGLAAPVTVWGYSTDGSAVTKPGGPVLGIDTPTITVGDTVTINFYNDLSEQTALLFQGQNMIPDLTGIPGGGLRSYTFTASKPGTFLYEAGLIPNAQHQVAMGLYGALVVRPDGAPSQAYASLATAFNTEHVLVLSELDVALNNSGNPAGFDIRDYNPKYYLINGVAYPDTGVLPVVDGDTVLLRYVNAGLQAHSMSTLGLSQTIIGHDGHFQTPHNMVAETIATGQTLDTLVSIPSGVANDTQYPVYDASLFLRNNFGNGSFAGLGGMLTMLAVNPTSPTGDSVAPVASNLVISPNPSDRTAPVTVTATIDDSATGNSDIDAAELYVDTLFGSPIVMTASDGTFDSPTEDVTGSIPTTLLDILATGDHTIYVRGRDAAGNWSDSVSDMLTVNDAPQTADGSLHFSTAGQTPDGPDGVGANFGDIYYYDNTLPGFSPTVTAILSNKNVDGFSPVSATEFYVSFTDDVTLAGSSGNFDAQNEDVVYFDGTYWSPFFDGTGVVDLLPDDSVDTNVDAISVVGTTLYFSTGDDASVVGGYGDDADIFSWDSTTDTLALVLDATAEGMSGNNVDGLVFISPIDFYVSYSPTSTPVAGLGIVQDEDVVHFDGVSWSVYFDGTSKDLTSFSLDVDAFNVP